MPNSKTKRKGDLRVKFKVVFPDLNDSERQQIGNILKSHDGNHRK
jgi:DnaJ-class molecular chaperone